MAEHRSRFVTDNDISVMADRHSEVSDCNQPSSRHSSVSSVNEERRGYRVRFVSSGSDISLNNFNDQSSVADDQQHANDSTPLDTVPDIENYRNAMSVKKAVIPRRPSLNELHSTFAIQVDSDIELKEIATEEDKPGTKKSSQHKLGWIEGVFMRDVLNIIGVMLFLRLSWITGLAGIGFACGIVLLSAVVSTITTLSMCAICTNGKIRGGGVYFVISRSLGPEFGGSIGIIFFAANAFGAAVYMAGFAETVLDIFQKNGLKILDGDVNDMRIIGWVTAVVLLCIVITGVSFESKAQIVLMVILIASIVNFFVGTIFPPTEEEMAQGITGYDMTTFLTNFAPDWRGYSFFTLLAIYFPAATGFLAGVNISGDLKQPEKAIPKGTLLSLLSTTIVYLGVVWATGSTCIRDAPGLLTINSTSQQSCSLNQTCLHGLANDFQILQLESAFRYLTTAGIFASTLSSALASFVSAPKVLQAIAEDKLFPKLDYFGKGYGTSNEPRRGYVFSFILIILIITIGRINDISPIITNFFMASYALINYACFEASFARSPGFRPAFKYYNMWLSMLGAVLCVALMFTINLWTALLTIVFIFLLHRYLSYRKADVNWGTSSQAVSYRSALQRLVRLQLTPEHVKNYRPQILVMTANPTSRPGLVNFVSSITKSNSLMMCGHVIKGYPTEEMIAATREFKENLSWWFRKRRVSAFYMPFIAPTLLDGVESLLQCSGISHLRPNILMLGYKNKWLNCPPEEVAEYFQLIHAGFGFRLAVGILRAPGGFKIRILPEQSLNSAKIDDGSGSRELKQNSELKSILRQYATDSLLNSKQLSASSESIATVAMGIDMENYIASPDCQNNGLMKVGEANVAYSASMDDITKNEAMVEKAKKSMCITPGATKTFRHKRNVVKRILRRTNKEKKHVEEQFATRIRQGTIDVWWLYDDGGLSILVPHLLTLPKSYLEGAKLRVFFAAKDANKLTEEQRNMIHLLKQFRINFSEVQIIADMQKPPEEVTMNQFLKTVNRFKVPDRNALPMVERDLLLYTDEQEINRNKQKTDRILKTAELLRNHSSRADLIVLTFQVPRRGRVSAALYMCWLEMLTAQSTPVLLLRGNQEPVLTFYS